ncbi:uncharacterized protein LOC143225310 [Tachypleus tridentatus]|uniref:uncharacterized protein LOC143225310 n=1 Tax=Tachypleus tridentatus TaxID=6853 RepID=UPI003FD1506C
MIFDIWDKAKIPIITPYRITDKLGKLHQEYYHLRKSKNRHSRKAIDNQKTFVQRLENLFDIAHPDALHLMKIQEDKDFLIMQRKPGRPGSMVGEDRKWVARETNKRKRLEEEQRRRDRWLEEQRPSTSAAVMVDSFSTEENENSFTFSSQRVKRSKSQRKVGISERLASALDRTQISDQKAAQILLPFVAHNGHNI